MIAVGRWSGEGASAVGKLKSNGEAAQAEWIELVKTRKMWPWSRLGYELERSPIWSQDTNRIYRWAGEKRMAVCSEGFNLDARLSSACIVKESQGRRYAGDGGNEVRRNKMLMTAQKFYDMGVVLAREILATWHRGKEQELDLQSTVNSSFETDVTRAPPLTRPRPEAAATDF